MHQAVTFQFERTLHEFARWRAVETAERSPAPSWWWAPAVAALAEHQPMPAPWAEILGLAAISSYADGAQVLLDALAGQTTLPWPDDFPRLLKPKNDVSSDGATKPAG
jgi:hypothetical protein